MLTMSQTLGIGCFGLCTSQSCEEGIISNFREEERALIVSDRVRMQLEAYQGLFNRELTGEREFKEMRVMHDLKPWSRWERDWLKHRGRSLTIFLRQHRGETWEGKCKVTGREEAWSAVQEVGRAGKPAEGEIKEAPHS